MPKKILLIENDSAFAGPLTESLEAGGFDVRVAPEGKSGLDLAHEWGPDGIVLCVELPGMSGYLVCQKLRKDEATRAIPLILTSAEASADTFEKHKALKVRADEYLIKPFVPGDLLEKLAAVGLGGGSDAAVSPLDDDPAGAEDLVSLDEEMVPEVFPGEPGAELPSLDLGSLPDDPGPPSVDEDLALLDEAFEGIATPSATPAGEVLAAAPPEEPSRSVEPDDMDLPAGDPIASLDSTSPAFRVPAPRGGGPALRPASEDVLRAAGIPLLDMDTPAARPGSARARADASTTVAGFPVPGSLRPTSPGASLRPTPAEAAQLERAQRELSEAKATIAEREAELASLRAGLDASDDRARTAEQELDAARDEAKRTAVELEDLRGRLANAERRAAEAARQVERIGELEHELESARTELLVARSEVEGAQGQVGAHAAELEKRIADLEAQSAKNEERVLKAYQKIKGDEKVKDKVRKAIAIAAQLLEEGLPTEPTPAPPEKPRLS